MPIYSVHCVYECGHKREVVSSLVNRLNTIGTVLSDLHIEGSLDAIGVMRGLTIVARYNIY